MASPCRGRAAPGTRRPGCMRIWPCLGPVRRGGKQCADARRGRVAPLHQRASNCITARARHALSTGEGVFGKREAAARTCLCADLVHDAVPAAAASDRVLRLDVVHGAAVAADVLCAAEQAQREVDRVAAPDRALGERCVVAKLPAPEEQALLARRDTPRARKKLLHIRHRVRGLHFERGRGVATCARAACSPQRRAHFRGNAPRAAHRPAPRR